jgi:hypothetical protein
LFDQDKLPGLERCEVELIHKRERDKALKQKTTSWQWLNWRCGDDSSYEEVPD